MSDNKHAHTILVAFTCFGVDRKDVQAELMNLLPSPDDNPVLDSWYVAQDDRIDGSDNDSAVYVRYDPNKANTDRLGLLLSAVDKVIDWCNGQDEDCLPDWVEELVSSHKQVDPR